MIKLPREIAEQAERIAKIARKQDLDFFPTVFEMLTSEQISQVAAYGGFPTRYPHWRFGMEYERLRKQHKYGLGKIYEMVINNDPCYAYLLNDNMMVDHKTVIAHVYGHGDFFKHNHWFSKTNRKMMDEMANHSTRVRRYTERHGQDRVESAIDTFLSLERLIDPHSMFMRRRAQPTSAKEASPNGDSTTGVRYPAKSYMDRYINPPGQMETDRAAVQEREDKASTRFPESPTRDVLLFLLEHARLERWQRDVLGMVREYLRTR